MDTRKIELKDFRQARAELKRLLDADYQTAGTWNLAQTATHLEMWLSFPMDGFPPQGMFAPVMWLMKMTMGKSMLKNILANGFKPGSPTLPATVVSSDAATDDEAVNKLTQTITRFEQYVGELNPSPLFGAMDKPTTIALQLRHFEHHLGFLLPKGS